MKHQQLRLPRAGYTLIELLASLTAATVLLLGMASSVFLSTSAFRASDRPAARRVSAAEAQRQMLNDLRYARCFSERTPNAVTFTVPDRTGDGRPDTIRYAWSGMAGAPLTYSLNGSTPTNLADAVDSFALSFRTQMLNAPVIPEEGSVLGTILFVSGGSIAGQPGVRGSSAVSVTAAEQTRITAFEAAGYDVVMISGAATDTDAATALATADVIYISGEVTASMLSRHFVVTSLGVVSESRETADELGLCTQTTTASGSALTIVTGTHHITSPFGTGPLTIADADIPLLVAGGDYSSGLQSLAEASDRTAPALLALNAGAARVDAGTVPGRRVLLPFGFESFSPDALNASGWQVVLRSIEWALGVGEDGVPSTRHAVDVNFGDDSIHDVDVTQRRVQVATQVALHSPGVLQSITVYIGGKSQPARVAIYSDVGGEPATLLAESAVVRSADALEWMTFPMDAIDVPAGTYWLAVSWDHNQQLVRQGTVAGGQTRIVEQRATQDGFLPNWGTSSAAAADSVISIYGTVTTQRLSS